MTTKTKLPGPGRPALASYRHDEKARRKARETVARKARAYCLRCTDLTTGNKGTLAGLAREMTELIGRNVPRHILSKMRTPAEPVNDLTLDAIMEGLKAVEKTRGITL